jgi:hypothetical protein
MLSLGFKACKLYLEDIVVGLCHQPIPTRQRALNQSPNFCFFIKHFLYLTYEEAIFTELADNGLSGRIMVVGANA